MARTQALMIQIATGDPRPISKQIVDAVRMKIATGDLEPGDQLPSVRGLAQQLTVNPNTPRVRTHTDPTIHPNEFRDDHVRPKSQQ